MCFVAFSVVEFGVEHEEAVLGVWIAGLISGPHVVVEGSVVLPPPHRLHGRVSGANPNLIPSEKYWFSAQQTMKKYTKNTRMPRGLDFSRDTGDTRHSDRTSICP